MGPILQAVVDLSPADREVLIVEQALLSAHFNWGVDPLPAPLGARTHFRKYFSDIVDVHDPRTGVPGAAWPAFVPGTGPAARHTAFRHLFDVASGGLLAQPQHRFAQHRCLRLCIRTSYTLHDGEGWGGCEDKTAVNAASEQVMVLYQFELFKRSNTSTRWMLLV